jgi:predicted acyltransferase
MKTPTQPIVDSSSTQITDPSQPLQGKKERLLSLDALRGFDMLLISGGGTFLVLLKGKTGLGAIDWIADQLTHPAWDGFTFYDFIFPLFLFMAGVSLVYSLSKGQSMGLEKKSLYQKAFRRMLILICLGILFKNAPIPFFDPSQIRLGSVLGRIGLASFVSTLLFLNFNAVQRLGWAIGILVAYYAALFLIPVPGHGAGDLSFEGNLVGWFDRTFLPGRLLQGTYDELGLLTQFPAMCLTIFGTLAGDLLIRSSSERQKIKWLTTAGVIGIGIGLVWNVHFPINKHLWSSSFVMLTAGMAFIFLMVFYTIIDVWKIRKWAFFFQVIGLNSLTIYYAYSFINFNYTSRKLFFGLYSPLPEEWHRVFEAFGALVLVWLFLYILYRKKIFIKV